MADSTTNIDTISEAQALKATKANEFFDAASPATLYGRRASACSGNTWGYYGGVVTLSSGSASTISNGTVTLTLSATNYLVAAKSDGSVTVSATTTNWNDTTNYWRLYSIVAGATTATSWSDVRELGKMTGAGSGASITVKDEGSNLTTAVTSFDFTGGGVTATNTGAAVTVSIAGSSSITAKDEGSNLTTALSSLDFVGAGVTATNTGGAVTVTIPGGAGREVLAAARTYYVRTDGSDSNTGLSDTAGGAFLTIQKAIDVICETLDTSIYTVTVQIKDGTFTGANTLKAHIGSLPYVIQGNATTPANVHINVTGNCFASTDNRTTAIIKNMKMTASSLCVSATAGIIELAEGIEFGTAGNRHINVQYLGYINCTANYKISGGGPQHIVAAMGGTCRNPNKTITLTGTPAFSSAFISTATTAKVVLTGNTYSGSATGSRYSATTNSVIDSGVTLPGDAAGTTATGGQYA